MHQDNMKKYTSEPQTVQRPKITAKKDKAKKERWEEDLSCDDLLFLLSILEGELQVGRHTHTHTLLQTGMHNITIAADLRC